MSAWPNQTMIGTDLDNDFQTLNDLFGIDDGEDVEPDPDFLKFSDYTANVDGSRSGRGFPNGSLKWAELLVLYVEALRELIPNPSAELYVRMPINQVDIHGVRIYRTFLCQVWWPDDEDMQGSVGGDSLALATVAFELRLYHMIIQPEAT